MTDQSGETSEESHPENILKKKRNQRSQSRRRVTLCIKRIREIIDKGQVQVNKTRLKKEIQQLRKDYEIARQQNGDLYDLVEEEEHDTLDQWENDLVDDVFSIEEEVEGSLIALEDNQGNATEAVTANGSVQNDSHASNASGSGEAAGHASSATSSGEDAGHASSETSSGEDAGHASSATSSGEDAGHASSVTGSGGDTSHASSASGSAAITGQASGTNTSSSSQVQTNPSLDLTVIESHTSKIPTSHGNAQEVSQISGQASVFNLAPKTELEYARSFDAWIDDLVEFQETLLPKSDIGNVTIADALFKLEANKDIPSIQLPSFDGDALSYTDFIDQFKIHIHDKVHLKDDTRMIQLRMHVKGEAERAISGLGSKGTMYATALKSLKEQFGQPSVIARAVVNKLTTGEKIGRNNREALKAFSLDIINCLSIMHRLNYYADINANDSLRRIVMRLPDHLVDKWKGVVADIRERGQVPTLKHIGDFVRKRVKAEFDPDFGDIQRDSRNTKPESGGGGRGRKGILSTGRTKGRTRKCPICEGGHTVPECLTLKDSTVNERFELVTKARLCFSCLSRGHMTRDCWFRKKCDINGCQRFHHSLLHTDPPTASGVASVLDKNGILPVVRVRFRAANGRVREGNVLIDSGATTTVIRKDFALALGLQGKRERIDLAVVGGETVRQPESRRLKFWISPIEGSEEFSIEAHEIGKTVFNVPPLDRQWLMSFTHLSDIVLSHKAGPVDLILGVQYSHLHAECEVRQGLPFDPVGKRTKLGWFVIGSDNTKKSDAVCSISFVEPLNISKFYELETLGVQARDCSCSRAAMLSNKAIDLMESSCKRVGNRYTVGLPWKKDKSLLPDNYPLAEKRLFSLERNLLKDEAKAKLYDNAITEYERNGWARRLSGKDLEAKVKPVHYLPHHGIYRPDKKSTPLRIVFDPACQYQGVSLNSFLHKGPGLIGNLLGVLLRFREEPIAFVGDISKMYLQIELPEEDKHVHRFLWRNLDPTKTPTIYALQRVTFGDKPSPDMASFVMLKIAKDNEEDNPHAAVILRRDRYMDDLIHSCPTTGKAVQSITELDRVLATGSFKIKEWIPSSQVVLNELAQAALRKPDKEKPDESPVVPTAVSLDGERGVKTLGVGWNPQTDVLSFDVKETNVTKLTKRAVLSNISRLYDPLGLASAVTIKARIALQDIWRAKDYDWDDPLPDEMGQRWQMLFKEIQELRSLEFPRCLQPANVSGDSELHLFADASAVAYGAVAYLLWPTVNGPEVRLVAAKARVAPLRQTTIPRLELMASLVASRLAQTICDEFKLKPASVTFWSDSRIVLHWLNSESVSFKPFVGVRVAEIQSIWDPNFWRFVPTDLNPADDLSRGIPLEEVGGRWKNGPQFLKRPKEEWPIKPAYQAIAEDAEKRKTKLVAPVSGQKPPIDPSRFSSWQKLTRVTAYALRFVHNIKISHSDSRNRRSGPLLPEEINAAETFWIVSA